MFVLDTNVVSELRRRKPHGAVVTWVECVPASQLLIAAVTIGEIQAGIEATRDLDPAKAREIERWLEERLPVDNVVAADAAIFRTWAKLMHHASDDHMIDALIAATALERGATVATRNVRDFEQFGVETYNPFG